MGLGGLDIFWCRVDAGDGRAHAGKGFAQQASAAADVQRALARQRCPCLAIAAKMGVDGIADKAQPHRVQLMQHRRTALRVPPVRCQCAEMCRFGGVYCRCGACLCHILSLSGRPIVI